MLGWMGMDCNLDSGFVDRDDGTYGWFDDEDDNDEWNFQMRGTISWLP